MKPTFLTHGTAGEVADLTGTRWRPKQIEALSRMGIKYFVAPDGWPRVPRSEIEGATSASARAEEPDFSTLRAGR